jgi:hypothetical protein
LIDRRHSGGSQYSSESVHCTADFNLSPSIFGFLAQKHVAAAQAGRSRGGVRAAKPSEIGAFYR